MIFRPTDAHGAASEPPIFDWAKRQPTALKHAVNTLFRAPILVGVSVLAIFLSPHANHTILVLAAALTVPVALNIVFVVLLGMVLERRAGTPVYAVGGLHFNRLGPGPRDMTNSIDPIFTVAATAGSFILAYAALYYAISIADLHAFHVVQIGDIASHPRLDAYDSLYFSTVTAATVGFGDIYPTTHVTQLLVASQILTTAAGVTLFVAYLLRLRRTTALREGPTPDSAE
jgi:hypothetical protein